MVSTIVQLNLLVKMTLTAWDVQNNYLDKLLVSLSDEQLSKKIAPGRNTGTYLLGHLIAVSDGLFPLLGFGERLFPSYDDIFIKQPDKSGQAMPTVAELKDNLKSVNTKLDFYFQSGTISGWFDRHTSISAEDFVKEPHRIKLNVIISRTNHLANHIGQLLLLK